MTAFMIGERRPGLLLGDDRGVRRGRHDDPRRESDADDRSVAKAVAPRQAVRTARAIVDAGVADASLEGEARAART
jgi:hypothetical protein